jgi:hypothetical protein
LKNYPDETCTKDDRYIETGMVIDEGTFFQNSGLSETVKTSLPFFTENAANKYKFYYRGYVQLNLDCRSGLKKYDFDYSKELKLHIDNFMITFIGKIIIGQLFNFI